MVTCSVLEYKLTYKETNFFHSSKARLLAVNVLVDAVFVKSLLRSVANTFLLFPYMAQSRGIETSLLFYIIKALILFVRAVYSML